MNLHHFAHKNEAHAFLNDQDAKRIEIPEGSLYQNQRGLILISGEGIFKALRVMLWTLANYPEINKVINLGVAGALDSKCEIGSIFKIRTSYAFLNDQPEFHSYSVQGEMDCISSLNRVTEQKMAATLRPFASIVDRELWGVAQACAFYKTEYLSYKIISDTAGTSTNCVEVMDNAKILSEKLFDYYLNNFSEQITHTKDDEINWPSGFYFTDNLKKQYKKLTLKTKASSSLLESIKNEEINEKKRTLLLINKLQTLATPFKAQTQIKIESEVKALEEAGAKAIFDPNFEKESFTLKMEINSDKNIENLSRALNEVSFSRIKEILNGEYNV